PGIMPVAPVHRNGVLPHRINFQRPYLRIEFISVQNFLTGILINTSCAPAPASQIKMADLSPRAVLPIEIDELLVLGDFGAVILLNAFFAQRHDYSIRSEEHTSEL